METIDLNQVLIGSLQALQPIAIQRGIDLNFTSSGKTLLVNLPMDEVLGPVHWFILRLLYIAPKGNRIAVYTMERIDPESKEHYLRIEIKTKGLFFNPNLIFRPDHHRFRIEHYANNEALVFAEWQMELMEVTSKREVDSKTNLGVEITQESNHILLDSANFMQTAKRRFEDYGSSTFMVGKLKATRTRKESDFFENALHAISMNVSDPAFDSTALGKHLCLSKAQLFRKLKALTGLSTANFIRHIRLQKATELLETTEIPIGEISSAVGFNELSYFSSSFYEAFKVPPSTWRKTKKMKQ